MTALPPSALPEEFSPIAERLEAVGAKFRLAAVLGALARFLALAVPLVTVTLFLVGYFSFPGWVNTALGVVTLGLVVLIYLRILHGPVWHRPTYGQIARWVEENASATELPLHNELINAVLLAHEYQRSGEELAQRTLVARRSPWIPQVLTEIGRRIDALDLTRAIPWAQHRTRWIWALAVLVLCLAWVALTPASFAHALAVFSRPNQFVPRVGSVRIVTVEPGDDTILAGQQVPFVVTAEVPEGKVVAAKIEIDFASGKHATYPMSVFGTENNKYRYNLGAAAEDMDYIITVGDSQSPKKYHLTVLPQIHLVEYKLEAAPPAYLTADPTKDRKIVVLAGKEATPGRGSIDLNVGATLTITATLDIPVHEAILDIVNAKPLAMDKSADGKTFSLTMPVRESFQYSVRVNDSANRTLRRFPEEPGEAQQATSYYTVSALPDTPPAIVVTAPAKDVDAKPGDRLAFAAQATDDHGLTEVALEIVKNKEDQFKAVQKWPIRPGPDGKQPKSFTVRDMLPLPADQYKFGDVLRYRFSVTDNRQLTTLDPSWGAQTTLGQVFSVNFNDTAAAAAKTTRLWDELRKQLTDLLERQVALRKSADALTPTTPVADAHKLAATIGEGQTRLRADMSKLAKDFPFEPGMKLVQKSLEVLVVNDATGAVDRANDIVLLAEAKALVPLSTRLRQHQSRIIDVLQSLLAVSASEQNKPASVIDNKDGGDIPNEAKKAWEKLKDQLDDFKKEQKAVIDATADLAKKKKDEYDQNDEKKFKDLAAVEDKWEKFLAQKLVDMSKIAEQDQANVSLLEELVQMKVELTMAKNALDQKQVEIATALEDNGLENAKELTTHIERWLSNKPDRQQWQMEEPVNQNDPKMAELPKQLQDMVSDLMDQEEDLTESMESMGSKWADSLDKGAGWDAMDGPISNMSAQGVTGNQMPKDMEIQGRSGEGREGRASGEMVGSQAEGKDGRRTPTRMTPEPFSSGQVEDKSKNPAGGATGGGKKGGQGGEGLEGPAPAQMQKDLQRLQGKQAAIRNQAERLELQMHAQGFNNFKLLESAVLMKKADDALRQYHYHTALYYQKQAVQSLNTAKVLANGQVHVTLDTSPTMSAKTQKDIEDALNGVMPKGYADPVKAYFLKLSQDAGKPE